MLFLLCILRHITPSLSETADTTPGKLQSEDPDSAFLSETLRASSALTKSVPRPVISSLHRASGYNSTLPIAHPPKSGALSKSDVRPSVLVSDCLSMLKTLTVKSAGERIVKIGQHLAK